MRYLVFAAAVLFATSVRAQATLTASPTTAAPGGTVTAAWSGIGSPSSVWIGFFTPTAGDFGYSAWRWGTNTSSGSVPFTIPSGATAGTYQLRIFSGGVKRATSNNFTVTAKAVGGTVTLNGSGLAGVSFTATNGGSCTTSDASGNYACGVPNGWSGTVTPFLANHEFTPASRPYSNVTVNQSDQDYAATVYYYLSGTVTFNGLPLANVALAASTGASCTNTNGFGQYICSVPPGWTGTITPSQTGYTFSPTSRNYSTAVMADDPGEDYSATLSSPTSNIAFVHVDHLNTPRVVSNASGTTVWRWDQMEPFGVNAADEDPDGNSVAFEFPYRYPGQYADKETNLHYNMARDYSSQEGRYIQFDPIGLRGGINGFVYAYDDPLHNIDPTGLAVLLCVRKLNLPIPGNHVYLWDDRSRRCCGRVPGVDPLKDCKEAGPPTDHCVPIISSDGKEDELFRCCGARGRSGMYFPWVRDCVDTTDFCIRRAGLQSPSIPGGLRTGICSSCYATDDGPPTVAP